MEWSSSASPRRPRCTPATSTHTLLINTSPVACNLLRGWQLRLPRQRCPSRVQRATPAKPRTCVVQPTAQSSGASLYASQSAASPVRGVRCEPSCCRCRRPFVLHLYAVGASWAWEQFQVKQSQPRCHQGPSCVAGWRSAHATCMDGSGAGRKTWEASGATTAGWGTEFGLTSPNACRSAALQALSSSSDNTSSKCSSGLCIVQDRIRLQYFTLIAQQQHRMLLLEYRFVLLLYTETQKLQRFSTPPLRWPSGLRHGTSTWVVW